MESLYIRASEDNTQSFLDLIRQFKTLENFLFDDSIHLSVSPTTVTNLEQRLYLDYAFDIDGVVVELEELSGLKLPVSYLSFPKPSKVTMRPVFHLLKKHIRSNTYSRLGFRCFQLSKGLLLAKSQVHFGEVLYCQFINFVFMIIVFYDCIQSNELRCLKRPCSFVW